MSVKCVHGETEIHTAPDGSLCLPVHEVVKGFGPERIAELRALAEDATPGPWESAKDHASIYAANTHDPSDPYFIGRASSNDTHKFMENARFIAAACTALPEALDEIERLRAELDEQRGEMRVQAELREMP